MSFEDEQDREDRLQDLEVQAAGMLARREAREKALMAEGFDLNAHVLKCACSWTRDGIDFYLCRNYRMGGTWCGYARFAVKPVKEKAHGGILTYVPVHGGISWAKPSPDGSWVYGFDCGHIDDREDCLNSGDKFDADLFRRQCAERERRFKKTGRERDLLPRPRHKRLSWLVHQCEMMVVGIKCAARIEDAYLATEDNAVRAQVIDQFHEYLAAEGFETFNLTDNFGAMINLLVRRL